MHIQSVIEKYIDAIVTDTFHRYKSWDICHQAFNVPQQTEILSLQLAFYLASWGMYRGSGELLQKNHLIHQGAVDIIFDDKNQILKCAKNKEVSRQQIDDILNLARKLSDYYAKKNISPTDTLLTKIMLGTLCCTPAFDRYFIEGLKVANMKNTKFNHSSLVEIFNFIEHNKTEFEKAKSFIAEKTQQHYPLMKIVDMYFWQIGYDKEMNKKQESQKEKT